MQVLQQLRVKKEKLVLLDLVDLLVTKVVQAIRVRKSTACVVVTQARNYWGGGGAVPKGPRNVAAGRGGG